MPQTGEATVFSPLIRRIVAPNPSPMTGAGTNTYLVGAAGGADVAVIDPGPDDGAHIDAIIRAVGDTQLRWILLTHTHGDHAPGALPLARRTGAPMLAIWSRNPAIVLDHALTDGETIAAERFSLQAIHTPGHASNHLCFWLAQEQSLFAGDLVMSGSTVVIAPPDGDMGAYLRSLERVKRLRAARLYPGHGDPISAPDAVIDEYVKHRLMRERQVLDGLASGPRRIADLVRLIYPDLSQSLHPMAALSVYAHLLKLKAEGRVSGTDQHGEWSLV
jgi:glyoxylase-like metal-dependent hydrolase (beta-lactamase superfamily II)